jgi:hypothetical protein
MSYEICQTCLLFPVDLTKSECASWVQAIGTILAIAVAVGVAFYQANRQQAITRQAMLDQANAANLSVAETLAELAKASLNLQKHFEKNLNTREAVMEAGTYGMKSDMSMLQGLEQFLYAVELHRLPQPLVKLGLILASSITQLRVKVEQVLRINRQMRAEEFDDLFQSLHQMTISLEKTVTEFEREVGKMRNPTGS